MVDYLTTCCDVENHRIPCSIIGDIFNEQCVVVCGRDQTQPSCCIYYCQPHCTCRRKEEPDDDDQPIAGQNNDNNRATTQTVYLVVILFNDEGVTSGRPGSQTFEPRRAAFPSSHAVDRQRCSSWQTSSLRHCGGRGELMGVSARECTHAPC